MRAFAIVVLLTGRERPRYDVGRSGVAAVDLDRDGLTHLAVASIGSNTVTPLFNCPM